jgi:N-methylhydantoinase B
MASLTRGKKRLLDLLNKYSVDHLFAVLDQLKNYSEKLMQSAIGKLPDGIFSFTDYLDDDGIINKKIPISVDLTIHGSSITADFSRSADQVPSPLNAVLSVTVSATTYVFGS